MADTTPPTVQILTFSPAPILEDEEIIVTFTGSDNARRIRSQLLLVFECVVDEGVDGAAFEPCSSPHSPASPLPGEHTFQVRSIDLAGNVSTAASRTFTVIGPPITTITSGPAQDA